MCHPVQIEIACAAISAALRHVDGYVAATYGALAQTDASRGRDASN
jgi:hypothetical protein